MVPAKQFPPFWGGPSVLLQFRREWLLPFLPCLTAAFHSKYATLFPSSIPFTFSHFPVGTNSRCAASPPVKTFWGMRGGVRGRGEGAPCQRGPSPLPRFFSSPYNAQFGLIDDLLAEPEESAVRGLAGAGQINLVGVAERAGELVLHGVDAVAEGERLVDVVGHENDRALFLHPDAPRFPAP